MIDCIQANDFIAYDYIPNMSEPVEILLSDNEKSKEGSTKRPKHSSNEEIFGDYFKVEDMSDPLSYLPQYQQHANDSGQCVQDCNICCGNICICIAYPFACCCCKCCCIYELETSKAGLIEEFGKFKRLMTPGFNMINPCSEEVHEVDLRINVFPTGAYDFITKDNVKVTVKTSVAYRIVNPIISHYVLGERVRNALTELTAASMRNAVGEETLDVVLTNRVKIVGHAKQLVMQGLPAGITVTQIFMEDIVIPQETLLSLSSAAKQRRISEANIINSKADVESASLLKEAADLLDTKAAMQIRYLEMVQELGKNGVTLMMPIGVEKKGYKN